MDSTTPTNPEQATQQEQGPDYGLNHDDILSNIGDIFTDGRQVPPAEGQVLHSCGKVRFDVLTNILKTRGVNTANVTLNSSGALLAKALPVWGVANFPARTAETIRDTTSSLVSLHDVMIAAAEEWVTTTNPDGVFSMGAIPAAACGASKLFNTVSGSGVCDKDGFACLMGATPTQRQLDVCNSMINDVTAGVTDVPTKRRLAIASMVGTVAMCD